jgi:hypothetical protein
MVEPVEWSCDMPGCARSARWAFTCPSCGKRFCGEHRLPERHACPFQPERSMAEYMASLRRREALLRGQPGTMVKRPAPVSSKPRQVGVTADLLEIGWIVSLLIVVVNAGFITAASGVFPNAACPVLIDGAVTSGVVKLAWERSKSLGHTMPGFQLLPGQRKAAKAWMGMFVAVAVIAVGTGIVACWGFVANIMGKPADLVQNFLQLNPPVPGSDEVIRAFGIASMACFISHVFAIIGVAGCGENMGKRRRAWYQEYLDWYVKHEMSP